MARKKNFHAKSQISPPEIAERRFAKKKTSIRTQNRYHTANAQSNTKADKGDIDRAPRRYSALTTPTPIVTRKFDSDSAPPIYARGLIKKKHQSQRSRQLFDGRRWLYGKTESGENRRKKRKKNSQTATDLTVLSFFPTVFRRAVWNQNPGLDLAASMA